MDQQIRFCTARDGVRLAYGCHGKGDIDVTDAATSVRTPTLIVHVRDDGMVPFDEGRLIATLIPDAIFVPLEGRNHMLLEDEPSWPRFVQAVRAFLGPSPVRTSASPNERGLDKLSPRERVVLNHVAEGLTNAEIADALFLSVRTVERHVSAIYAKLGLTGKAARAAAAAKGSLLERDAAPARALTIELRVHRQSDRTDCVLPPLFARAYCREA